MLKWTLHTGRVHKIRALLQRPHVTDLIYVSSAVVLFGAWHGYVQSAQPSLKASLFSTCLCKVGQVRGIRNSLKGQRWMEAAPVGLAAPNVFTVCNLWEESCWNNSCKETKYVFSRQSNTWKASLITIVNCGETIASVYGSQGIFQVLPECQKIKGKKSI